MAPSQKNGSELPSGYLDYAIELAKLHQARLTLLHVEVDSVDGRERAEAFEKSARRDERCGHSA